MTPPCTPDFAGVQSGQTGPFIDSRGRPCPLPVIDLARAIAAAQPGQRVTLLADDPGAATDIPAWCRMRGQQLVDVQEYEDHSAYVVERTA